jgi:NADH dehydrogenase
VLLLTGATGLLGHAVVRRLVARGTPVRCLVRDPRRLGGERVRVQLAIGDLADPASWRNALRGVHTVVHLAGGARDQPRATVEELNGLAAWRLLRAAERVGARHFVWITPLGATPHHPMRMHRAKALAAAAVAESALATTTLAHSLIYSPGDRHLLWLERLGYLPVVPLVGRGIARTQPIWVEDAADCVLAAVDRPPAAGEHARHELAGPETLTQHEVVRLVLAAAGRRRRALPLPLAGLRAALRAEEALAGPTALVTWDEAQLLAVEMLSAGGTAGAEALGVIPRGMRQVLGVDAPRDAPSRPARRAAAAIPR